MEDVKREAFALHRVIARFIGMFGLTPNVQELKNITDNIIEIATKKGDSQVLVEVEGGVADVSCCDDGVAVHVVDWDHPANGGCAWCGEELPEGQIAFHGSCAAKYNALRARFERSKDD